MSFYVQNHSSRPKIDPVMSISAISKWRKSANDMKIFIVPSESSLNARKIALYRFLIPCLVPELSRFKDLKNDRKNGARNARSWIKSIKIDKICDVMLDI